VRLCRDAGFQDIWKDPCDAAREVRRDHLRAVDIVELEAIDLRATAVAERAISDQGRLPAIATCPDLMQRPRVRNYLNPE